MRYCGGKVNEIVIFSAGTEGASTGKSLKAEV
jgi:hypothetical protein